MDPTLFNPSPEPTQHVLVGLLGDTLAAAGWIDDSSSDNVTIADHASALGGWPGLVA